MGMMEQVPFNFDAEDERQSEPSFETLNDTELALLYKKKVGIDPVPRSFNRETLLQGIADPATELDRLREIDQASDREELAHPYKR